MLKNLTSLAALALLIGVTITGCTESAVTSDLDIAAKKQNIDGTWRGNGAPSGSHFQFNMIGVENPKNFDLEQHDDNGRRMFVKIKGNTKIMLTASEAGSFDFDITDPDGTDGYAAFTLPVPDDDCDGVTDYSVFIRALGQPQNSAVLQSCYVDNWTGETYCADDQEFADDVDPISVERIAGQSKFENVSKDLLYVDYCASWSFNDLNDDGVMDDGEVTCDRWGVSPLFMDDNAGYLWDYENDGLRLVQFRFYPIPDYSRDGEDLICDPNTLTDVTPQ